MQATASGLMHLHHSIDVPELVQIVVMYTFFGGRRTGCSRKLADD